MCQVAILKYDCGHKQLFLLDCAEAQGHNHICSDEDRELISLYRYKGRCEDCEDRFWAERAEKRMVRSDANFARLYISNLPPAHLQAAKAELARHDLLEEHFETKKNVEQRDELDLSLEWVREHAAACLLLRTAVADSDQEKTWAASDRLDLLEDIIPERIMILELPGDLTEDLISGALTSKDREEDLTRPSIFGGRAEKEGSTEREEENPLLLSEKGHKGDED